MQKEKPTILLCKITAFFTFKQPLYFLRLKLAGKDKKLNNNNSNLRIAENGHIRVKNLSAYWIPNFKLQKVIGGTLYTVTGSYEGTETLDKKLSRILAQDIGGIHDK